MIKFGSVEDVVVTGEGQWTKAVRCYDKGLISLDNTDLVGTISILRRVGDGSWILVDKVAVAGRNLKKRLVKEVVRAWKEVEKELRKETENL